jgi:hypothetical protein
VASRNSSVKHNAFARYRAVPTDHCPLNESQHLGYDQTKQAINTKSRYYTLCLQYRHELHELLQYLPSCYCNAISRTNCGIDERHQSKIQNELPPSRPVPRDVEFYAGPRIADVLEHFQNLMPTSLHGWWTDGQIYTFSVSSCYLV